MIVDNPEVLHGQVQAEMPSVRLLVDASDSDGVISVQNVKLPKGLDGAVPHFHKISHEFFYVVSGTLDFWEDGRFSKLSTGDCALVSPNVPHAFGAERDSNADVIVLVSPGVERFEYFRLLAEVMEGRAELKKLMDHQEEFDTYFVSSERWDEFRQVGAG